MAKRYKKWLTWLLVGMLALLLAGCGKQNNSDPGQNKNEKEDAGKDDAEKGNSGEDITFPLVEEKTTITYWVPLNSTLTTVADSYSENEFYKRLEEKTNVHIDFKHPAVGNEASSFNLMIASGELTDMLVTGASYVYPDGLDAAVDDGYFLDLTDLLPQYAPHYLAALDNIASYDENYLRVSRTDKGRMVCVSQIMIRPQGPFAGLYVREDWLKDVGMEVPVTYDDWEEMLTAFKEQKGATAPLMTGPKGYDDATHALSAGYGVMNSFYQENGVIKYGPAEEGFIDCNYGIEGDTFEYVDGKPVFNDKITHNDTYTFAQAMALYTMPPANVCWQDWTRELAAVPEKDVVCYDIWEEGAGNAKMIPSISALGMSVEDNQEYAKIMADVTSIVDEKTSQFISGAISLDEYDAYLDSLQQMKIGRAIELIQKAYDSFMER